MKEFLHDHIYGKEYEVRYDDTDRNHEMRAVSVLNYLEDAALAHSAYVGYPLQWFLKEKKVWVLTQVAMEMTRYPHYGERFTVETWPTDFGRFRASRNFRLKDAEGDVLGGLATQWIYFDLASRRPAKTTDEMKQGYGTNTAGVMDYEFNKLGFDGPMYASETLEVRRSDIDSMGHVNNKRYVKWMVEAVPEEIYRGRKIYRMEIAFLKEAQNGPVRSGCALIGASDAQAVYFHKITSLDGQTEHAAGKTYWGK